MGLSLPAHGFVGLLTDRNKFKFHFSQIAMHTAAGTGLFPEIKEKRLLAAHTLWREEVMRWFSELDASEFQEVSHIKMAGALLWSLLRRQCCPVRKIVEIEEKHLPALTRHCVSPNIRVLDDYREESGKIVKASPNPTLGYIFTSAIFNSIQRGRGKKRDCIDLSKPPMTYHFFKNLSCWYLVERSPSKEDLYMLFKTMDLYGLNLPRNEGLPRKRRARR